MLKKILWAYDFSEHALGAGRVAKALAQATGAQILAVYAARTERLGRKDKVLRNLAEDAASLGAEHKFLEAGDIPKAIVSEAESWGADLIVMGKAKVPEIESHFAGPVARRVLSLSPVPVLLACEEPGIPKIESVMVPVDFSETSKRALEFAKELSQALGAQLEVLHVFEYADEPPTAQEMERAREKMDRWLGSLEAKVLIYPATEAHLGIKDAVLRERPGLVVMGSRGLSGIEKWLLGSVTERALRLVREPVIVVKD